MMSPKTMVDLVIGVLLIEGLALTAFSERLGLPRIRALLPNLAAGLFLLFSVRSAFQDDGLVPIASFLALAGIAHLLDLRGRRNKTAGDR